VSNFFNKSILFIQQGCVKLIKSDSKEEYITFFLYLWSNRCRLDEQKKLLSETFKIVMCPTFWHVVYINDLW